ncbi:hypothetical protein EDC04DRAFT_643321 [Pisolithus marmoratus]|nr:hypothetical protein EDC04DRAFT_643321 [Pisolithus marmoratus]
MVNTILRDDPTRGDMDNKEELSPRRLWTAICHNYDYGRFKLYCSSPRHWVQHLPDQPFVNSVIGYWDHHDVLDSFTLRASVLLLIC